MTSAVEFRGVTKRYGSVTAVEDISFAIAPATLVTLLGPSGCGKTTTLRMIAGLEMPSAGTIRIAGCDVTRLSAADRNVSMVFQSYALFPHMTVLENAAYGPLVSGMKKPVAHEMAAAKLALVGLSGLENRLPSELSGGQQQRVAVARALVLEPEVLLFDEPLSNLDAKLRRRVREEIRELQQRLRLTVAYVTHDQQEALAVSDRIIVMSDGRIAQEGAPRELYEQPASGFVADFIGDSNSANGEVVRIENEFAIVRIAGHEMRLKRRAVPVGPVRLAIRPEAIRLSGIPAASGAALSGIIIKAAYLGTHMEYVVESQIGQLFVVDQNVVTPFAFGRAVEIEFAAHGVVIVL
ncbi:MAG: ABC transporter ATP-binding protein [Hyphomicrobiaceae bacterium]